MGSIPGSRRSPWRRKWQPTPVFLPGKSHGQRSLADNSSLGHREADATEHNGICKWKMRLRRERASQPLFFVRFWCPVLLPSWSLWLWMCVCAQSLSHVQLLVTPWTVACQSPLSMGFPRQEYWSGLPFPPLRHLVNPGIEPASPALAGRYFTTEPCEKPVGRGSVMVYISCTVSFLLKIDKRQSSCLPLVQHKPFMTFCPQPWAQRWFKLCS